MKAPYKCPMCGALREWGCMDSGSSREGFSIGKATTGAFLLGPAGIAVRTLEK